jgi:hypothetical protein
VKDPSAQRRRIKRASSYWNGGHLAHLVECPLRANLNAQTSACALPWLHAGETRALPVNPLTPSPYVDKQHMAAVKINPADPITTRLQKEEGNYQ